MKLQTRYGIDYLGAGMSKRYLEIVEKHHPHGYAAGFLMKASGWRNGIFAARALAATGKCPIMRIHGIWHDSHYFTRADIAPTVREAARVAKLHKRYPDIKIYFSPWLEHRASNKLFNACCRECRKVLPRKVTFVNSGPRNSQRLNEVHHSAPLKYRYMFSYDGANMFKSDVKAWKGAHSKAKLFFGWAPIMNGKESLTDNTLRSQRTRVPSSRIIRKIVALLES